ncbi:Protein kinase domain-containing protein [Abeliophyllum distichum]|uniref:Protein kinase domain-containing protein n=1 Tax=Abeliophyllum distichum TaxID=126358 RepID=A0ABD1PM55_9LAMI
MFEKLVGFYSESVSSESLCLAAIVIPKQLLKAQAASFGDVADQLSRNLTAFEHNPEDILDCCNGLFLLASRSSNPTQYYVTNPTTSECITIPVNPLHDNFEYALLAFDPTCYSSL